MRTLHGKSIRSLIVTVLVAAAVLFVGDAPTPVALAAPSDTVLIAQQPPSASSEMACNCQQGQSVNAYMWVGSGAVIATARGYNTSGQWVQSSGQVTSCYSSMCFVSYSAAGSPGVTWTSVRAVNSSWVIINWTSCW